MFSKEEALQIKKDFWIAFAAEYPRKWLLYNTKIKDVTLEIEFKEHIFLKDFTVNDMLRLENFNDLLNKDLHILQISEIIENNYVSYEISKTEDTYINLGKMKSSNMTKEKID